MIKMNDVGETNGEMALWIDGKRVSHLGKGFPTGEMGVRQILPRPRRRRRPLEP